MYRNELSQISKVELRHLRYFCAVAEELHVTRAALRLHIAQPALTQQIKQLEITLETPLLRRVGRGIELTEAGAVFYREALLILDEVRSCILLTHEAARGGTGSIAIGLTEASAFSSGVTEVLNNFREQWPAVKMTFVQKQTVDLLLAIDKRQIDAAFVRPFVPQSTALEQYSLFCEPVFVALPKTHELAAKSSLAVSDLAEQPLILISRRERLEAFEMAFQEACDKFNFTPRVVQESPEMIIAINLVAMGVGLLLVPESLKEVRSDKVVYVPLISQPPLRAEILLVFRSSEDSLFLSNLKSVAMHKVCHNRLQEDSQ